MNKIVVDHEFVSTFGIELAAGRDFSKEILRDNRMVNLSSMRPPCGNLDGLRVRVRNCPKIWPQGNRNKGRV